MVPHLPEPPRAWIVAGGGARNRTLMRMLAERLAPATVETADAGRLVGRCARGAGLRVPRGALAARPADHVSDHERRAAAAAGRRGGAAVNPVAADAAGIGAEFCIQVCAMARVIACETSMRMLSRADGRPARAAQHGTGGNAWFPATKNGSSCAATEHTPILSIPSPPLGVGRRWRCDRSDAGQQRARTPATGRPGRLRSIVPYSAGGNTDMMARLAGAVSRRQARPVAS